MLGVMIRGNYNRRESSNQVLLQAREGTLIS
jgi:hypothetical protein